ncbi:MAG TPA: PQQ-binding-like beta-propeller repeat protein [Sedimentisphaerales bacterium]|nr:PQQ-binding-like beta-propeller repeat protein [Sedimentisphaerales bacterium]
MGTNYRNKFFCMWCSVTLALMAFNTTLAENWPCFRGPTRQGISNEKGVPLEWSQASNIVWKRPIPGEGWSSPIVFDERVFVTTATDGGASFRLLCLDRLTGTVLWNKQVLRQKPGHKQNFNSYASSSPVTDGRRVYVLAFDGTLAAVSMEGSVIWTHREFEYYSEHGLGVSPILYRDLLIVPFDGSSSGPDKKLGWQKPWDQALILALDKNTGNVQWRGRRGSSRIAHITPQVLSENGRDQLVSSAGNVVQGFNLKTGERIWTVSSPGEGVVPSVVIGDGLIFTTSGFGDSTIRAVRTGGKGDVTKTHIAWESTDDVSKIPSMLYVRPFLFLVTETGVAKCLRAETGEVLWRERLEGRYSASPIWADGRIYFLSEQGKTTVVQAGGEFKVLAENELNEKCCASPAVSQKHIFIRSENNLYCIGPGR